MNGKRYSEPVAVRFDSARFDSVRFDSVRFDSVRLANGRKPSPAAQPRGGAAPTTRASG